MAKDPFLPLFFGDFLGATAVWSGEEQALYLLLLGYQWASGALPADPQKLACMARYEPKRFRKLWETVGKKFVTVEGGILNLRLEEHRKRANELAEVASARGKAGASKRWGNAPSNAPSMPEAMLQASSEHRLSNSSIPLKKEEEINPAARPPEIGDPDESPDREMFRAGAEILGSWSLLQKLRTTHGDGLVLQKLGEFMTMTEKPTDPKRYFLGIMRKLERRFVC